MKSRFVIPFLSFIFVASSLSAISLYELAARGQVGPMVDFMNKNRVNPNVKDEYGNTPLHYAVISGSESAVKFFLVTLPMHFCIPVDINVLNKDGQTAEELARMLYQKKQDERSFAVFSCFRDGYGHLRISGRDRPSVALVDHKYAQVERKHLAVSGTLLALPKSGNYGAADVSTISIVPASSSAPLRPRIFLSEPVDLQSEARCSLSPRTCASLVTCSVVSTVLFIVWLVTNKVTPV